MRAFVRKITRSFVFLVDDDGVPHARRKSTADILYDVELGSVINMEDITVEN